jgi:predicted DNA-binding protein YlxM (UPF0122 family)
MIVGGVFYALTLNPPCASRSEIHQFGVRFIYFSSYNYSTMAETISVNKQAIFDLIKVKDEFDSIIESLELMADKGFMESYNKSRAQIEKRDFADWNAL